MILAGARLLRRSALWENSARRVSHVSVERCWRHRLRKASTKATVTQAPTSVGYDSRSVPLASAERLEDGMGLDRPSIAPLIHGVKQHIAVSVQRKPASNASGAWTTRLSAGPLCRRFSSSYQSKTVNDAETALRINRIIVCFRTYGHLVADLDPLQLITTKEYDEKLLDPVFSAIMHIARASRAKWRPDMLPKVMDALEHVGLDHVGFDDVLDISFKRFSWGMSRGVPSETRRLATPYGGTFRHLLDELTRDYAGTVAAQYSHVSSAKEQFWLEDALETRHLRLRLSRQERVGLLQELLSAQLLELFMADHFRSVKRFGLEGAESLVCLVKALLRASAGFGAVAVEMGMAHRGRLTLLSTVLSKPLGALFSQFRSRDSHLSVGDVKYHLGTQALIDVVEYANYTVAELDGEETGKWLHTTPHVCTLDVSLCPNPSHLELVGPVVMGRTRAHQRYLDDETCTKALAVVIHGDAAFSGQGIVSETLQLSQLDSFGVGGTVHIILNNQIGFTTSPDQARSTVLAADVAMGVGAPIFHCNADDPEAVVAAIRMATEYRFTFHKPVIVDLVCYRRQGHNEMDDPSITQPRMYERIAKHPPVTEIFAEKLVKDAVLTRSQIETMSSKYWEEMKLALDQAHEFKPNTRDWMSRVWPVAALSQVGTEEPQIEAVMSSAVLSSSDREHGFQDDVVVSQTELYGRPRGFVWRRSGDDTGVHPELLQRLAGVMSQIPAGFNAHPDVRRLLEQRTASVQEESGGSIDWATAEALAFASLLHDGYHVRLSGQDSERGTFNQRHAVLIDQVTGKTFSPLNQISQTLRPPSEEVAIAEFLVANSTLSELAVMAYEYGFSSCAQGRALVCWEAQFGDFANGAQALIDTFFCCGEEKWRLRNGLVLLLPHGMEGQGPEHSSARLERFLQLCNDDPDFVPGSDPAHEKYATEAFQVIDTDGSGSITRGEVLQAMRESYHGLVTTGLSSDVDPAWEDAEDHFEASVDAVFDYVDADADDNLTLEEWQLFFRNYTRLNSTLLCNMVVAVPTTPANYFHLLRRHQHSSWVKPLVVLTPKALLHHGPCVSSPEDFASGTRFQKVFVDGVFDPVVHLGSGKLTDDVKSTNEMGRKSEQSMKDHVKEIQEVQRVIFCTGKVFYSLRPRLANGPLRQKIVVVRLEQLFPFPYNEVAAVLRTYAHCELVWCQEEPKNQGAWAYASARLRTAWSYMRSKGFMQDTGRSMCLSDASLKRDFEVRYVGRQPSAVPATGSFHVHREEERRFLDLALRL